MDLLKKVNSAAIAFLEMLMCHEQCLFYVSHCFLQGVSFFISFRLSSPRHEQD